MGITKNCLRSLFPRSIRNWLRSPGKSVLWLALELEYLLGRRETVQIRPDWSLRCHPLAHRHSYFSQLEDPDQIAEFDSFLSYCRKDMILFDLGAHFGLFSLAALHFGGPDAKALAVDASPSACRMIRIQAKLNQVDGQLHVLRACVSDQPGYRDMVSIGVLANGYFCPPDKDHTGRETSRVPAVSLDQLVEQFALVPTHVKIDVEGFEESVLRGGKNLLSGDSGPILFLEIHNRLIRKADRDPQTILNFLAERDYSLRTVNGEPPDRRAILEAPLVRVVGIKEPQK